MPVVATDLSGKIVPIARVNQPSIKREPPTGTMLQCPIWSRKTILYKPPENKNIPARKKLHAIFHVLRCRIADGTLNAKIASEWYAWYLTPISHCSSFLVTSLSENPCLFSLSGSECEPIAPIATHRKPDKAAKTTQNREPTIDGTKFETIQEKYRWWDSNPHAPLRDLGF